MKEILRYATAAALRQGLEERLNASARERGLDVQRLRRQVAFDRFLARVASAPGMEIALKGGYALELRLRQARTTKDIDISLRVAPGTGGSAPAGPAWIQDRFQAAAAADPGDHFEFVIGVAAKEIGNAPAAGWRLPVEARLAGRQFIRFSLDVVMGDPWLEPHERVTAPDWLGFAGIEAPRLPVVSREQQFAEKLHAYTMPRRIANSRVKDLVDLLLLLRLRGLSARRIRRAAEATFRQRGTHPFPPFFPLPEAGWSSPLRRLARECGLDVTLSEAGDEVGSYCERKRLTA